MSEKVGKEREELLVQIVSTSAQNIRPIDRWDRLQHDGRDIFPRYLSKALKKTGRERPMPVQAQGVPVILAGHDLIGRARTGSGKTLTFLLPAIVHVEPQRDVEYDDKSPIVLITAPTRELVQQISDEGRKLLLDSSTTKHPRGIYCQEIYGGKERTKQIERAKGCAIIAA